MFVKEEEASRDQRKGLVCILPCRVNGHVVTVTNLISCFPSPEDIWKITISFFSRNSSQLTKGVGQRLKVSWVSALTPKSIKIFFFKTTSYYILKCSWVYLIHPCCCLDVKENTRMPSSIKALFPWLLAGHGVYQSEKQPMLDRLVN